MSKELVLEQSYEYSNESYSGCDMVATILMSTSKGSIVYSIGELQTISYSIHMDRRPVRSIGNINAKDYVLGPRTIAGSLVFAVFNKHFAHKLMDEVDKDASKAYLIDEFPPFDIIISFANEYGLRSRMAIYGVRLVNEGQVMSINDIYTENTYQFVATDLEYLSSENQYISRNSNKTGSYLIKEKTSSYYQGDYDFDYKEPNFDISSDFDIKLNYKIRSVATQSRLGIVDFWLTPARRVGTISIKNENTKLKVNVPELINGNNRVSVQLAAGDYEAVWSHEKEKSNTVKLSILESVVQKTDNSPAPLIESVGDTFIKIYSNVKGHTKAIYENENGERFSVDIVARKATIENLNPDSLYMITTSNDNITEESKKVKVKTLAFGYDLYKDFLDYLSYNKRSLKQSDFNVYEKVVWEAKDLAYSGKKYDTIINTFVDIKKKYEEELSNLDKVNFPDLIEYEKEVDRITSIMNGAEELTILSSTIVNDSIYGYNYETMVVEPPILEYSNGCTNKFLIEENIRSMDFFRHFTTTSQFSKTITNKNFEEDGDYYICTFNGRPSTKHYTYAVNQYGFRSPRVDFYSYGNEERAIQLEELQNEKEDIEYEITKANSLIGGEISEELNDNERIRVLTEYLKSSDRKATKAPFVNHVSDKEIELAIDEYELLKENNARVVIEKVSNALMDAARYKQEVDETVVFTVEKHGLRPGVEYCIWIEDSDEYQISDCITCKVLEGEDLDEEKEYEINRFFIEKEVQGLKEVLENDQTISNVIKNILDRNESNIYASKTNILDCILEDILIEGAVIDNLYGVLYSFYKYYFDSQYTIDEDYFTDDIYLYKDQKNFEISEDCIMKIIDIYMDGVTHKSLDVKSNDKISIPTSTAPYTMINFTSKDLSKRSGFLLISNLGDKYITYKLQVKVGE